MCVCVATRLEGISVWVWVDGRLGIHLIEGVESVGVCVWLGGSGVFRGC